MIENQKFKETFIHGPVFFKWMGVFHGPLFIKWMGVFLSWLDRF